MVLSVSIRSVIVSGSWSTSLEEERGGGGTEGLAKVTLLRVVIALRSSRGLGTPQSFSYVDSSSFQKMAHLTEVDSAYIPDFGSSYFLDYNSDLCFECTLGFENLDYIDFGSDSDSCFNNFDNFPD
ncbi:hypothetical protein Tco_0923172 [Tanacetum coccineum]|uniref:Uncharacterized protein n=1 Tax=Tanacetum coccineum TaxID=301880 RepID=A0ABQ5D182_9ASTR